MWRWQPSRPPAVFTMSQKPGVPDESQELEHLLLEMIIHGLIENKGICNYQISYSFTYLAISERGLLLGLEIINMDTQPLVPYWDLLNQVLPLN